MNRDGQNKLADHCLVWILAEAEEAWWANTPSGPKSAEVTGKRRKGRGSHSSQRGFFCLFFWHLVFKAHCTHLSYVFYFFWVHYIATWVFLFQITHCSCCFAPTRGDALLSSWWATVTSPPPHITTFYCKHSYLVQKYTHLDIKLSVQIEEVLQNIIISNINKFRPKDFDERLKIIKRGANEIVVNSVVVCFDRNLNSFFGLIHCVLFFSARWHPAVLSHFRVNQLSLSDWHVFTWQPTAWGKFCIFFSWQQENMLIRFLLQCSTVGVFFYYFFFNLILSSQVRIFMLLSQNDYTDTWRSSFQKK